MTQKNNQEQTNKKKTKDNLHILQPKNKNITNLFKHTNVGISFKNTDTLWQLTKLKIDSHIQEQDKSGIYELTCHTSDRQTAA